MRHPERHFAIFVVHGMQVSPELISMITDALLEEVTQGQSRPLEPVYVFEFLDPLWVTIRD